MRRLVAITLLIFAVIGCEKKSTLQVPAGVVSIRNADASLVLAKFGNRSITCRDFRERMNFECGLWKIQHPKARDAEKKLERYCQQRVGRILPELLNQQGVALWAEENGIALTESEKRATEREVIRKFGYRGDIAKFARDVGCPVEYASRQVCASALWKKACVAFEPNSTNLTEKEIDDGLGRLNAYYERAIASNAVTWATCSNLLVEIKRGLDFQKAADRYSYSEPEEGKEWGDFLPAEIEDAKLKVWAYSAPVGSMGIFELDDGISIVKILRRNNGSVEKSVVALEEAEVVLARINFAMVEPEPEPRTREHVHDALLEWKANGVRKRLGQRILERFPVAYPDKRIKLRY